MHSTQFIRFPFPSCH